MVDKIFDEITKLVYKGYIAIADAVNKKIQKKDLLGKIESVNTLAKDSIFYFPVLASNACDGIALQKIVTFIERKNAILIKLIVERIGVIDLKAGDTRDDIIKKIKGFDKGIDLDEKEFTFKVPDGAILLKENKTSFKHSSEISFLLNDVKNYSKKEQFLNEKMSAPPIPPDINDPAYQKQVDTYDKQTHQLISSTTVFDQRKFDAAYKKYQNDLIIWQKERDFNVKRADVKRQKDEAKQRQANWQKEQDDKALDRALRQAQMEPDFGMYKGQKVDTIKRNNFEDEFNRRLQNSETVKSNKTEFYKNLARGKAINADGKVIHQIGNTAAQIQDRKVNMAEPTQITISFSYYVKGVCAMSSSTINMAVKSTLHTIPAQEIHDLLPKSRIDDTKFLIKLGKLTSGEIKFFKDFVFSINTIKKFITGDGGGKNNWINKLKFMTQQNRYRKHLGNQILPTYSLAMSIEEVEQLRIDTNDKFDLMQEKQAKRLIESLSLLNFIIIDEANERLFWLEDAESEYNIMTYKSLEGENRGMSQEDLFKVLLKIGK